MVTAIHHAQDLTRTVHTPKKKESPRRKLLVLESFGMGARHYKPNEHYLRHDHLTRLLGINVEVIMVDTKKEVFNIEYMDKLVKWAIPEKEIFSEMPPSGHGTLSISPLPLRGIKRQPSYVVGVETRWGNAPSGGLAEIGYDIASKFNIKALKPLPNYDARKIADFIREPSRT